MKKNLLKSLLLTLMVLVGGSAWAQTTYFSQDYEGDGATADWTTGTNGRFTPVILEESGNHFLSVDQGTRNNNGTTISSTSLQGKVEAGTDFTMQFDIKLGSSTNQQPAAFQIYDAANSSVMFSLTATGTYAKTWKLNESSTTVELEGSGTAQAIDAHTWYTVKYSRSGVLTYLTVTKKADGTVAFERAIIDTKSENGGLGKMQFITKRYNANFAIDNIVVREIVEGDVPAAIPTTYTIKFNDESGNTIKEDAVVNTVVGIDVAASADYTAAIYANDKKYIYKSGNDAITTVEDEGSNVITLVFREAASWSYTLNAVSGENILQTLKEGTAFEQDKVTLGYPLYINVDSTLWKKDATNQEFRTSFTLEADNQVTNLAYTATEIKDVIFLKEGEDIDGVSKFITGNSEIRSSNAGSGYSSTGVDVTTLATGKYKMTAVACVATGTSNFKFKLGNREVYTLNSSSNNWASGESTFVVAQESTLTFSGGNANQGIDFIYIQSLGEPSVEELAEAIAADNTADSIAAAAAALAEAKATFLADINAAKAIDTIGKNGAAELAAAITAAEAAAAAEDATAESIAAAKTALAEAVAAFNKANRPDLSNIIANADFASLEGWTAVTSASFHDQGNGLIGEYKVRSEFAAATVDETHLATEYCIGVEARWASSFASYTQETAELPAGEYMLMFDVENVNGGTSKAAYENRFTVTVGETVSTDTFTEWMDGKSAWTTHGIKFALTETGKATISLGYGTGENNYALANTPALFISHLSLVTAEEGDSILKAIKDAKDAEEKAKNEAELAANTEKLQGSSYANPSADLLVNGSFDTANEGWSLSNMGYQANQERPTRYVEKWQPGALTGSGSATQTIKNLPAGAYLLKGTAHTNKDEEADGAKISINDSVAVVSGTWKEYEILYNLSEAGDITVSFSFNNIASNWVAIDEFSLVYGGDYDQYIADKNKPVVDPNDYTSYIVNADLTGEGGFDATGTKGIDGSGIVKVGNAAAFDFKQTIENLPAGKYKVTAQAAYRYGADEAAEAAAIAAETDTKLVQLYATVGEKTVSAKVQNRYDGASETDYANGNGSVTVNEKFVPNSSDAVKAWFAAGQYVNEVEFNLPADGAVTIGINRISTPESDYTVIGPWTLTRIGDAEEEPEPEPIEPEFAQGKYIFVNVASEMSWGAGNSWGTQASLVKHPEYNTLIPQANGTYYLESQVSNGGTNYYFNGDFMDNDQPVALTIKKAEPIGFSDEAETDTIWTYTIANGENYFGWDGTSTVLGKNLTADSENALWLIFSLDEAKAALAEATVEDPSDATFLIEDHDFGRNNRNVGKWTAEGVTNISGGNDTNNCAESYHSTFTLSQVLADAPKGVYALTAQGFYRQDGEDNEHLPVFFANDSTATFPLKTGAENSMSDASASFSNGLYTIEPIFVEVAEGGTLTIGAKLEENTNLWCIWDNFVLTYYGADATIDEVKNGAIIAELAELREKATDLKEEVEVAAVKTAIEEALAATENVEGAEAINAAIATMKAVVDKAEASVIAKDKLANMKQIVDATNVYTEEALNEYYTQWEVKYLDGSITKTEAYALQDPFLTTRYRAAITVDNFLLSAWDTNPDFDNAPYYINTWSNEGETDGSEFKVPFFEYWTGDGESLGEKTLTATMNNLEAGNYEVKAWVRVRIKNGAEAPAAGITFQANDGEAVNAADGAQVGESQFYLKEVTATGTVAEEGVLNIKFNIAADNNISWLSFKNVKFEKMPAIPEAIEGALYSWESTEGVPGEYGGTMTYVNGDGNRLNYKNGDYYTICLNGKKANMNDETPSANAGYMSVMLDEALSEGDTIKITAYINKNASGKKASAYILFDNGADVESPVYSDEANIDPMFNGVPTETSIDVTAAMAGAQSFKMTRGQTGTNLFITKFVIMKKNVETGITMLKTAIENGAVYNMNGQKVNKAQKGLYIINGRKVVIK